MAIFISYSHDDYEFVEALAHALIDKRYYLWLDKWQLTAGDSIVEKVQSALTKAEAILVILSSKSVNSNWCKKELNSGLIREIDESKVILLPILIEECDIPLFLREKKYADFRNSFEDGLKDILDALGRVTNLEQGRLVKDTGHNVDWAIDYGYTNDVLTYQLTFINTSVDNPYSVLTEIILYANDEAKKKLEEYINHDVKVFADYYLVSMVNHALSLKDDLTVRLTDQYPQRINIKIADENSSLKFDCAIKIRRLGDDSGFDNLVNVSGIIADLYEFLSKKNEYLTAEESEVIRKINERYS